MRFQSLQIPAFGPFTNLDLQFPEKLGDLHVIYGANEAGKSSLLRAIRDLLFGIHVQSPDNFLHDYGDLRIKGEIRNRAGAHLVFQRRKGKKNTLLDEGGTQLPDNALAPFLGSVDQAYFSAMFGLGTQELHEGAQQLLRGKGNIGTALFSANLGGTPVQKIVEALRQEAEQLFKGNAWANVTIRPAATRYKELLRQSRDAMANPETGLQLEKEWASAEAKKKVLEVEISKLDRALQWISRCEDALPTVGRLSEEAQKLEQIPPLPDLASDFTSRAKEVRQDASAAQAEVQGRMTSIDKLHRQLEGTQTAPAVLAQADALDQLHQDFGVYRERKKALTRAHAHLAELEPLIRAGMDNLLLAGGFASLENHRLSSPVRLACEEAAAALQKVLVDQTANSDKAENLELQLTAQETELQSLLETDLTGLREALVVAAGATEADRTFLTGQLEVDRLTRETTDLHQQVAGAPVDLDATAQLDVSAISTLRRYHERMEDFKRTIGSEEEKINVANQRAKAIQAELGRLQRQGELPTEEALRQGREHRDLGWSLVLADWKGGGAKEELVPGLPLEEAFPLAIVKADGIADKLRFEAEAVAQAEEKRSQLIESEAEIDACQKKILKLQADLEACQKAWQTEWTACGITPRSPLEMEEWRKSWIEFRERLGKLRNAEESFKQKRQQIQQAKKCLAAVLGQSEEKEFLLLFATAKKDVQDGERSDGQRIEKMTQRANLKSELAKLEKSRSRLAEDVSILTAKWNTQCLVVGLPELTSPEAGRTLLQERKELLVKFDQWQKLSKESQSMIESISQYEKDVVTRSVALDIKGDTTEALDAALWRALTDARKSQERRDQMDEQIIKISNELTDACGVVTQTDAALNNLLMLAGLTTAAELEPLLAHLEQRAIVQFQIDNLRKTLSGLARGQPVDEFAAKVRAEDPDTLSARKSMITNEKVEKETTLSSVQETLFRLSNEKQKLEKSGDAAADFRQQAESFASALKQDGPRFMRLRLATHLLEAQIEQFRKENQGPLLQKSGEVFNAITRGAFSGLGAEFNADDVPILVGVRPDQTKVPIEGLSDGSRDQLYLALRLAALDRYLEEHEPMPLILDDLLITFDNERTRAILPQLARLAKRTQIFLFTHHEHLVELCRETIGEGQFKVHRL